MTISSVQIDEILQNMDEFRKKNFGIKNGKDFIEIANALSESEKFKLVVQGVGLVSLLSSILIPIDIANKSEKEKLEFIQDLPIKDSLADIFYAGYKLGLAIAEVNKLNELK
jgi:CO dehydrogenase/acetyl-CoA synthase gamma subunit (corrinoid Fe-S protein)